MNALKLDHIVILVRSLEASLPWYATILGLLGFEKARENVWWNGEVAIDVKEAKAKTRDYERFGPGLNHLGFTAAVEADLDRICDAMAVAGFEVPDKQQFGADIATFFKDPDGMRLEVTVYG
ncbi:MAG TPA: VOC family protein [Sphingomicrobium sp.]|jgi:lactoylglutathione lyase|nr:VOC family protein [Sphingomicrobium sp.]